VAGRYAELLGKLQLILQSSGCSTEEFESIAEEASNVAVHVFRSPMEIIAEGNSQALADASDLILIGAIVARYGMVMGNPFAGKE
jgi:cytochrome c-type biogenesis protein CcmH/NrfF